MPPASRSIASITIAPVRDPVTGSVEELVVLVEVSVGTTSTVACTATIDPSGPSPLSSTVCSPAEVVREMISEQVEQRQQAVATAREQYLAGLDEIARPKEAIIERLGGQLMPMGSMQLFNQIRTVR